MRKTALRSVSVNSGPTWNPHGSRSDKESPDDLDPGYDDGVASGGGSRVLRLEYHILYSCSYMAPVLYFRASTLGEFSFVPARPAGGVVSAVSIW